MPKVSTANVYGISGKCYRFEVYSMDSVFKNGLGGVYLFARRSKDKDNHFILDPIYVGETDDLAVKLFGYHPKQRCIQQYNVNCKCVYLEKDASVRKKIAEDIIKECDPLCQ